MRIRVEHIKPAYYWSKIWMDKDVSIVVNNESVTTNTKLSREKNERKSIFKRTQQVAAENTHQKWLHQLLDIADRYVSTCNAEQVCNSCLR